MLAAGAAGANPRDSATKLNYAPAKPVVEPAQMGEWLERLAGKYRIEGMVEVVLSSPDYDRRRCGVPPPPPDEPDRPIVAPLCESIKGRADCIRIGTGPGVQCIIQAQWHDMYELINGSEPVEEGTNPPPPGMYRVPGGESYLGPSMLMIGMDPGKSGVNYLLVDNKGLPEGGLGSIAGNRATFRTPCVNGPVLLNNMKPQQINYRVPTSCDREFRIDAKDGSSVVHMAFDVEINDEIFTRFELSLRREK
jgi:hypothetical protein